MHTIVREPPRPSKAGEEGGGGSRRICPTGQRKKRGRNGNAEDENEKVCRKRPPKGRTVTDKNSRTVGLFPQNPVNIKKKKKEEKGKGKKHHAERENCPKSRRTPAVQIIYWKEAKEKKDDWQEAANNSKEKKKGGQ